MSTSSRETTVAADQAGVVDRNTPNDGSHVARLFALADHVDFLEQLDHAGRLIDRRRSELLAERRRRILTKATTRRRTSAPSDEEEQHHEF